MKEPDSELGLETLWAGLLSQKPAQILRALARLDAPEHTAVLAHLREMAAGEGWQPAQREAAQFALGVLEASGPQAASNA
jgi:hypothetical protein